MKKIFYSCLLISSLMLAEDKIIDNQKTDLKEKEINGVKLGDFEKSNPTTYNVIKDFFNAKYCTKDNDFIKFISEKEIEEFGISQQFGFLIGLKYTNKEFPFVYENIISNFKYMNCYKEKDFSYKPDIYENPNKDAKL